LTDVVYWGTINSNPRFATVILFRTDYIAPQERGGLNGRGASSANAAQGEGTCRGLHGQPLNHGHEFCLRTSCIGYDSDCILKIARVSQVFSGTKIHSHWTNKFLKIQIKSHALVPIFGAIILPVFCFPFSIWSSQSTISNLRRAGPTAH
jgi:hypothetical protein